VGGAPNPATRHPVTERSEVEVPRSDIAFDSWNIPPDPVNNNPATKTPDNGRPGRRGVEERQRSRATYPQGRPSETAGGRQWAFPKGHRRFYITHIYAAI